MLVCVYSKSIASATLLLLQKAFHRVHVGQLKPRLLVIVILLVVLQEIVRVFELKLLPCHLELVVSEKVWRLYLAHP